MAIKIIKPLIFMSYSTKDTEFVHRVRSDLNAAGCETWIDSLQIGAGDRLHTILDTGIPQCSLFFAYITQNYLQSTWCQQELELALQSSGLPVATYVDSEETQRLLAPSVMELHCSILDVDKYPEFILDLSGRAWGSLQSSRRLVPGENHIQTGSEIFDSHGYSRTELMARTQDELILAGPNLRSWLSDPRSTSGLLDLMRTRHVRVTLILATYDTLRPMTPEGALHLRQSVDDIKQMRDKLDDESKSLLRVYFHVGAATLSAVFVDPQSPDGLLFFNPRWAIQFLPQDRLTCVIDKTVNSWSLYKAIYNGVLLMTQLDALSLDQMFERRAEA